MLPALRRPLTASAFVSGMIVALAIPLVYAGQAAAPADLHWVKVNDQRLQWSNVAAWEPRGDPTKPIVAMTPVFTRADHVGDKNRNGETPQDYRNAIATVVRQRRTDRNLYCVDGLQAFKDPLYLLPTDVVHPNVAGSLKIADTLAAALRPVLGGAGAQSAAGP